MGCFFFGNTREFVAELASRHAQSRHNYTNACAYKCARSRTCARTHARTRTDAAAHKKQLEREEVLTNELHRLMFDVEATLVISVAFAVCECARDGDTEEKSRGEVLIEGVCVSGWM